jgi:hypothetical protein
MKPASIITFIIAVVCLIVRYVLNYWLGYYEESYTPIFNDIFLWLAGFILLLVLIIIWIISLFRKKHRLWTTTMLTGLLVLNALEYIMPRPSDLIIYGMRNRMMHDCNLDTLRDFARDFDRLARLPNNLPGSTKGYMNEDLTKTGLKEKYPFLNWLKGSGGFEGPSSIAETDGVVDVRWGGALAGRWGFSVAVNDKRINPPAESGIKFLRVSDDIYFIIEND